MISNFHIKEGKNGKQIFWATFWKWEFIKLETSNFQKNVGSHKKGKREKKGIKNQQNNSLFKVIQADIYTHAFLLCDY